MTDSIDTGVTADTKVSGDTDLSAETDAPENLNSFHDFALPPPLMRAIDDLGYELCTPIQSQVLPLSLADYDVTGQAQTGTGKTAAFLITILTHLWEQPRQAPANNRPARPRALVLAPTRELAMQIESDANDLGIHMHEDRSLRGRRHRLPEATRCPQVPPHRYPDRHAGPPDRFPQPRPHRPALRRDPGHRRGRPHARHGVHPGRAAHRLPHPAQALAPDPVLQRHLQRRRDAARRLLDPGTGTRGHRTRVGCRRDGRAEILARRRRQQNPACSATSWPRNSPNAR